MDEEVKSGGGKWEDCAGQSAFVFSLVCRNNSYLLQLHRL